MATIATQAVSEAGSNLTQTNCNAGGDKATPGDSVIVEFDNRHATNSYTVTLDDPTSVTPTGATAFNPDTSQAVPAGAKRYFKLSSRYTNPADGLAAWTYSATPTTMTVCVFSP